MPVMPFSRGGFYKFRCKYFYSHNCPNWVWVNLAPCATCLAEGRDAEHDNHHADNDNDRRPRRHPSPPDLDLNLAG